MAEFNSEVVCAGILKDIDNHEDRICKLEGNNKTVQELAINTREMVVEMRGMKTAQEKLTERLEVMEKRPIITLDNIFRTIITVVITATIYSMFDKLI